MFHARLVVEQGEHERSIDIRPSDAIALAVRTETPIHVAESVMDQASVVPDQPITEDPADARAVDASKLSPFKDFLDTLEMDDLGPGGANRISDGSLSFVQTACGSGRGEPRLTSASPMVITMSTAMPSAATLGTVRPSHASTE